MADFNNIVERLERYSQTINKAVVGTALLEAFFVLVIGILSNNISNSWAISFLVFVGLLYLLLLFIKTIYNQNFPGSITNELKSERQLAILTRDAERKRTINDFLVTSIARLNGQTCALNYGDDTHLCDQGITEGIHTLIEPVIDNISFMLDVVNAKFTVGLYLKEYASMTQRDGWDSGIILIDDKLQKVDVLPKELMDQPDVRDESLSVQAAIRDAFNNHKFVKQDYPANAKDYTILCSPIPFACDENDMNGVLFIIGYRVNNIPADTDVNMKIFNRVISNWLYRYNECISSRRQN